MKNIVQAIQLAVDGNANTSKAANFSNMKVNGMHVIDVRLKIINTADDKKRRAKAQR